MANVLRFFLDENVQVAIADQLRRHEIEVITARDLEALGDMDETHLAWAARLGYVICTHDSDFLEMAGQGMAHSGIIFGQQHKHRIGDWVKFLVLAHAVYDAEDIVGQVEYL